MNWDEKAEDYAGETGLSREAVLVATRWQRDQLRTPEAIERVARGICRRNWPKDSDYEYYWQRYGDDFRADARAAIAALLGPDHTTHHEGCGCV